ncbi:Uncharacterized protein Adt_02789 [Abeliophyllum distichum]|uniref:Retrotransposon gag domain-containing protein n=1 Tax=Abeliophyllum distichum TaxID=126358 RepID=A0ABD1VWU7_9LAMI
MQEEVRNMIFGGDTAYSFWKSLQEQLFPDTEENEAPLKNGLYALSKGTLSLDEYIRKFKEICDKLAAIGKPLGDADKVFYVSQGLGDKFKEFRNAVFSKPPYLSFNQFITRTTNVTPPPAPIENVDTESNTATNHPQQEFVSAAQLAALRAQVAALTVVLQDQNATVFQLPQDPSLLPVGSLPPGALP